jgi:hypothetical protein
LFVVGLLRGDEPIGGFLEEYRRRASGEPITGFIEGARVGRIREAKDKGPSRQ